MTKNLRIAVVFSVVVAIQFCVGAFGQSSKAPVLTEEQQKLQDMAMFTAQLLKLSNENGVFANEIDLLDYQKREMAEIYEDYSTSSAKLMAEIQKERVELEGGKDLSIDELKRINEQLLAKHLKSMQSICESSIKRAESILVAQQLSRLKQLAVQYEASLRRGEGFRILPVLLPKLDLSNEDEAILEKAVADAKEEFQREREKLRRKFEKQVLEFVDDNSRKKLEALIGAFFYFDRK